MRRRHVAEVPRITSRSKLRSRSFITFSVHQIPLPSVLRQSSPSRKPSCVTTHLRNWESSCANYARSASYFGHLTYHLAAALFFTGCRFHEWAQLTFDRLVHEPGGVIIAARLQLKQGSFRDLPLTKELSDSLEEWVAFLESVKGVRLRTGGVDFAGSPL